MENKNVNVAVLGCGYWGKNLVRNFRDLGALKLVCDISESGRKKAEEMAPEVERSASFSGVFERTDIDAVVLATPAETHESLALEAIEAGKDVYVEKPMALDVSQGKRMLAKAREHDRILMVGHILEYHPAVLKLRELIDQGELGDVRYVFSNRLNFGKIRTEENALWSFAPHDIAVILRLVGEQPSEVTCVGGSYITPGLADVTVSCMEFASGPRAHVFVSWLNPFKEQKLVVVGSRKMAVFNDVSQDQKLTLYDQRVDVDQNQPLLCRGESEVIAIEAKEPLREECAHFLDCVRERKTPLTDGASGLAVLSVLEACQNSLGQKGAPVSLKESL